MDNKKLNEQELEQVTGGDIDIRKDLYENIILSTSSGEQNGMLNEAVNGEMKIPCPKCRLNIPASYYDDHIASCNGKYA